jgi:protein O-mannosyl-transferase
MLRIAAGVTVMAIGLVASSLAWRKWPALGFTAAAFFLVLAPTSSVVPILSQVMAEHRMYLPLAAVVTIVVLGLDAIVHRWAKIIFAGLAVALTLVTVDRNKVYGSELMLWSDTVERVPYNARAHYLLADGGRADEAKHEYETVIRLEPGDADARNKLGRLLLSEGQSGAAIAEFTEALRINPEYGDAHNNLAVALVQEGRFQDALTHFAEGIRLQPAVFEAYFNFGNALVQMDRLSEARLQYEKALRLRPDSTLARDMMARIDIYLNRQ